MLDGNILQAVDLRAFQGSYTVQTVETIGISPNPKTGDPLAMENYQNADVP